MVRKNDKVLGRDSPRGRPGGQDQEKKQAIKITEGEVKVSLKWIDAKKLTPSTEPLVETTASK